MEIIEKMNHKSQSSGPSDSNFNNFNDYDGRNYKGDLPPY